MRVRGLLLLTAFAAAALAALLGLGVWQLQRLQWKEGLIAEIEARTKAPPISLDEAVALARKGEDFSYLRVCAEGRFDHAKVCVAAVAGGVEINDVDPPHSVGVETSRDRDRVVVIVSLAPVVALLELYDTAATKVYCRIEVHGHAAATFTKLASSARPTASLFSGWNCVAHNGPRSIAAANLRP